MACKAPMRGTKKPATGTKAGYTRHQRAGEKACSRCLKAIREYNLPRTRQWYAIESNRKSDRAKKTQWALSPRGLTHSTWRSMIARCYDERHVAFKFYGARGTTVCARWRWSFEAFIADMGARKSRAASIDRIDNSKGYSPGNCRWATRHQQRVNQGRRAA